MSRSPSPDTDSSIVSGSTDATEPDYSAVEIPSAPPSEYSYVERRAELLQIIESVGHPRRVNQTELAERFGVSQQQISKDIDRIATHVRDRVGDRGRRTLIVDSVMDRSVRGLLDDGEWRKAARTVREWDEWAREIHDLAELEERIDALEELEAAQ